MPQKIGYWISTALLALALLASLSYLTGSEQVVQGFAKAGYPQHLRTARRRGVPATIYVPEGANPQKVEAMRRLGATVNLVEPGRDEADAAGEAARETGALLIEDGGYREIAAGAGTIAQERTAPRSSRLSSWSRSATAPWSRASARGSGRHRPGPAWWESPPAALRRSRSRERRDVPWKGVHTQSRSSLICCGNAVGVSADS